LARAGWQTPVLAPCDAQAPYPHRRGDRAGPAAARVNRAQPRRLRRRHDVATRREAFAVRADLASEDHHVGRLLNHRRHWTGWPAEFRLRRDDDIARQQVTRLKRRGDAGQSEVTSPKFYGSIFLRGPLPGWDPFDGAPGNDISKCVRGMMLGPAWESRAQGPRPPGFELSPQGDRRWNPRSGEVRRITVTTSRSRPHYR